MRKEACKDCPALYNPAYYDCCKECDQLDAMDESEDAETALKSVLNDYEGAWRRLAKM